jgi:hypothetical protein
MADELGCLSPVCIGHNQVNRRLNFGRELRSELDRDWAWVKEQRSSTGLNEVAGNHAFVATAVDSDFAIEQGFRGESCGIRGEHFFAGVHQNHHSRLE